MRSSVMICIDTLVQSLHRLREKGMDIPQVRGAQLMSDL